MPVQESTELTARGKIGILLTAGGREKVTPTSHRIEPDLEGKVRSLGAVEALRSGLISKLYVLGGQQAHGEPISKPYFDYLQKLARRHKLDSGLIERLAGRVDTLTDLERVFETLPEDELRRLIIFSSGFHVGRGALIMRTFGFKVDTKSTEKLVKSRSRRHKAVVDGILNPAFKLRMFLREMQLRSLLLLDLLPGINQHRFGYRLTRYLSTSQRKGE